MSNKPFIYQAPFPMGKDNTEYYLLTSDYVSVADFDGETILKVEPEALTLLAQQAFHDASFMLRPAHQKQAAILKKLRNRRQRRAADLPGYRHRDHRR